MDVEAGMFPGEKVGEFFRADELGVAQGVKEAGEETQDLKTQEEEGFARCIGIDAHRDAATSDSSACCQSWTMKSLFLVFNLESCRLGSLGGFRWRCGRGG